MARFIIEGGHPISGTHKAPGNKNAALPMLAACVLTDEPVVLQNVPLIDDVRTMLDILCELGVSVETRGHTVTLCAKGMRKRRLPDALCRRVRSSILFAGPMAARHGRVTLFPPGGDGIGRRPLDTHFCGLRQLGIRIDGQSAIRFTCGTLKGTRILLEEASVTATENVLMAAVLAEGETTIFNAACEPHVQDLCNMLNKMGAAIKGIGTNFLTIQGVSRLHGVRLRISPDYVEAASFLAAAALTGGSLQITNFPMAHWDVIAGVWNRLGLRCSTHDGRLALPGNQSLRVRNAFGTAIPRIEDGPWPSFPSDLMSIAIVLATQAKGTTLFFEKMFESRMYFVDRLIEMGARIVQCDPHRIITNGPSRLQGMHLTSPDIRAGMALLLAALCARGHSTIDNAQSIDRGYESVDRRLRMLGARIDRT